jgi:hypothetical protein
MQPIGSAGGNGGAARGGVSTADLLRLVGLQEQEIEMLQGLVEDERRTADELEVSGFASEPTRWCPGIP